MIFHGCIILYSHQKCIWVPVTYQLTHTWCVSLINFSQSCQLEVLFHGFKLYLQFQLFCLYLWYMFFYCGKKHINDNFKCIFRAHFSIVKYMHIVVQRICRTLSRLCDCDLWNNSSQFPPPPFSWQLPFCLVSMNLIVSDKSYKWNYALFTFF